MPRLSDQGSERVRDLASPLTGPCPVGAVLQDYSAACDCIDWKLSRHYWEQRGPDAFLGGDVPYVVTNDGYLAGNAVAVVLAACTQAQEAGALEQEIQVLELGAGSGLFAKQFLDQLQGSDDPIAALVYERMMYSVSDGSEAMIEAITSRGLLADHADHVKCLIARAPGLAETLGAGTKAGVFRAVFANYLLDSLPFSILSLSGLSLTGQTVHELRLRTAIAPEIELAQYTHLNEAQIIARFQSGDVTDLDGLSDLYPALVLDGRYDPVERSDLPLSETLPAGFSANEDTCSYLHCYGALACIQEVLTLLRPDGFMLISDYGNADEPSPERTVEFQHFGGSVAIGLNFEAIDRVFDRPGASQVYAPDSDTDHLLSRLITKAAGGQAADVFRSCYSQASWDRLTKPLRTAQEMVSNGQIEAARWKYQEALRLQPYNWSVLEEVAGFLCYHLDDYEGALKVARASLELNFISPGAWNIVGDCFFYSDHLEEAADAYNRAAAANPKDVRALLNLAWIAHHEDQLERAFDLIAKGLAYDIAGAFREALLSKQEQVLARQSKKHTDDTVRSINRIHGHANLPGRLD